MLGYTILLGLVLALSIFHARHKPSQHHPIAYEAISTLAVILMFAGNILYSFGWVTPLLRRIWKFVFPFVVLSFIVSGILNFYFDKHDYSLTPAVIVLTSITAAALFFPSFWANFLLGYGTIDRVRRIQPPVTVGQDPLRDLVGEIKKLRRTTQILWMAMILLLSALVLNSFFQVHFEKNDDSWVTVRRLADAAKYEQALAVAHRLVDKDPDSPQTRILMGNLQLQLGQLHQAESSYTRAYELLPNQFNANLLNAVRKRIDEAEPTPTP
jgi:tetratricopeptide (TPR) repeat protein